MTKPDTLKGNIKGGRPRIATTWSGRTVTALWARSLTTQRVADLFRTLPGLPGHWMQLQMQVNAGNHHFCGGQTGHQTTEEGKVLIRWIADAVIKAAERQFDFNLQQLRFTADMGWLKLHRVGGRVLVLSRP